jgi:LemA protein
MEHLIWIIPTVLLIVIVIIVISIYNGLVNRRNVTKNAWSQIDVQLKRRYDLIPNLVETVKGYMKHEQETLENVIKARQQAVDLRNAGNIGELMKADGALTQSLGRLFAVAEGYPDLKANQNMLQLQEELTSTENRIGFSRQAYNDAVMRMNNAIEMFPASIIAGFGNFQRGAFWEVESAEEKKNVKVSF